MVLHPRAQGRDKNEDTMYASAHGRSPEPRNRYGAAEASPLGWELVIEAGGDESTRRMSHLSSGRHGNVEEAN